MKSKHGSYSLHGRIDVLHLTMEGSLTLDLVQAMRREMDLYWRSRDGRPWALYSDLTRFEAMPPEALDAFWALIAEAVGQGLVAATDIRRADHFRVTTSERLERHTRHIKFQVSTDEQEAMRWIAACGLRTD
ncbi:hypothetical protein ABT392_00055 [Paucibacter sp. JuS9]|uniref:hypothetical protein n=1 Tax=Roseateles TaxID=93681 RepID=UPI002FE63215